MSLNRRVDALEEIAERCRQREQEEITRTLARERGLDFESLLAGFRECQMRTTAPRIEEAAARRIGGPVDVLRARRDELLERFGR